MVLSCGDKNYLLVLIFLAHAAANILAVVSVVSWEIYIEYEYNGGDWATRKSYRSRCIAAAFFAVLLFLIAIGMCCRLRNKEIPHWNYGAYVVAFLIGVALRIWTPSTLKGTTISGFLVIYPLSAALMMSISCEDFCECGETTPSTGTGARARAGQGPNAVPLLPEQTV